MNTTNITIPKKEMPEHFVNIIPYLKKYLGKVPEPPLPPGTKKPISSSDLEMIFPKALIQQEMTMEQSVEIPDEVKKYYTMYRPTPMVRARQLEKSLDTPAHIYFKNEGATLSGSHKINTALAQAYYNKEEGIKKLTTETGAGQWGSALSMACNFFDIECKVFMVRISFDQKPYRKNIMQIFGSEVFASPSLETTFGKMILEEDKNHPGSLGIAISEALELAALRDDTKYALGSVLNHVLLHQTIVGQEAKKQMEITGEYPDCIIGCVGGGSNFAGFAIPFLIDKISGKRKDLEAIAVESSSCPKMTKGEYRYDFGDTAMQTPLLKMETLGSDFIPPAVHAGGLRYHGNAPILSFLNQEGITKARSYNQIEAFEAGVLFARTEGIIPAPESAHAIKAAIDEAKKAKNEGKKKVIVFNLSGNGLLDLKGYGEFLDGKLL